MPYLSAPSGSAIPDLRGLFRVILLVLLSVAPHTVFAGNGFWSGTQPRAKSIEAIARDPLNPSRMWAAAFGSGVYRSLDGGATWAGSRAGLTNTFVRCLAVNPHHPDSVYCGTNDGVFLSTDGGVNWSQLLATTQSVRGISIHPYRTAIVYAATYGSGIFKSFNGGGGWSTINLGLVNTNVRDIALHPLRPDTLLAATGTGGGLHQSLNGGLTWTQIPNPVANQSACEQIAYDPLDPQRIYVAQLTGGVIRTSDGGVTWSHVNRGLTNTNARSIAVLSDSLRYVGTAGGGVFVTTLSDSIWHPAPGLATGVVDAIFAAASGPLGPDTVWAGTDGDGILRTRDHGVRWAQLDGGLLSTFGFSVAVDPATHTVYDGSGFGDQFWRSTNSGASWTRASYLFTHNSERAVVVDPVAGSGLLFLASYGSGVYRSIDGGSTWSRPDSLSASSLGNTFLRSLAARPGSSGRLLAGTGDGVYSTNNAGATWTRTSAGLPPGLSIRSLAFVPAKPETVYAGSDVAGAYRSVDGGATWSARSVGLGSSFVHSLLVDSASDLTVYAGTDASVYKSIDGGATWALSGMGIPLAGSVRALVQDRLHGGALFCAVFGAGVFESTDGGANWSSLFGGNGLTNLNVYSLAIDPSLATLYAGTDNGVSVASVYPALGVPRGPGAGPSLRLAVWPNPASLSGTAVRFTLPHAGAARLSIFGISGAHVRTLVDRSALTAGDHTVSWDARDGRGHPVDPGMYFLRIESGGVSSTTRLVVAR